MDYTIYLRSLLSLVLVLGLMLAVLWLIRRYGLGGMVPKVPSRRRLAVVESLSIDGKRRLLLVRRDDAEHLLLVGGGADLVVEASIPKVQEPAP